MSIGTVTLFAASKLPRGATIAAAAEELGQKLAIAGFDINYGGGTGGLMGKAAGAAADAGGRINAFVLERYADEEQIPGANIVRINTEQERFSLMSTYQKPVAMIVLPGGPGALREALQALEAAVYDQGPPVILIKVGSFLNGIKDFFEQAVGEGLVREEHKDKLKLLTVKETIDFLEVTRRARIASPAPNPKPAVL